MKKVRYLSLVIGVSLLSILTGCNSNNGQNNQSISEQQYTNNEDVSANEPYANEEDVSSQYILIPHTVYKGTIDGGFDPLTGELTTDKKHNETSFEIQAYKDGGITFSFDNKVYEEGWGVNMSGQLEGNWDEKS